MILLAGETGAGAILGSLALGLREGGDIVVVDTSAPGFGAGSAPLHRARRRLGEHRTGQRVLEAARQLKPDAVLLIKGRGLGAEDVHAVRHLQLPVACFYPDNPRWTRRNEPGVLDRLRACDLTITFSERHADVLRSIGARTAVLPFGYDPRWYPITEPSTAREGIAFLGTWSRRRQRYLASLIGLPTPLVVRGTGWGAQTQIHAGPPVYEREAGSLLSRALIGINLFHPQNAGAHNMRTREITASGALQLTDRGTDGTPLRPRESCTWFSSPDELRQRALDALADAACSRELALRGQQLTAADTYHQRGMELMTLLESSL